jgi:crotonobetainyl-CoA:carnitine CoA-transferase CaiB-like acyl-CoA transferase
MTDAIFSWVSVRCGEYFLTEDMTPPEKMSHITPANDIYDTADGQRISIGAVEEHFWQAFVKISDPVGLLQNVKFSTFDKRRQNAVELKKILQSLFCKRTLKEWIQLLEKAGVPYAPVQTITEAFDDPQLQFRKMITEMFVPHLRKTIKQVAFPVKMPATPTVMALPPPALGEHTVAVLTSFGFSKEELEDFRCRDIIR